MKFVSLKKLILRGVLALSMVIGSIAPVFATGLTYSSIVRANSGSETKITGAIAFDSSYPTNGEAFTLSKIGLNSVSAILFENTGGRIFEYVPSTGKIKVYVSAGATPAGNISSVSAGTPAGTNGTSAVTGTAAAQTFTGSASKLNNGLVSGTGYTASGQTLTTTQSFTATLDQYAGYWIVPATLATPPNLIISNTAVAGAPIVFTVQGAASSEAGVFNVVGVTPVGVNSASASLTATAAAQTFTGSALGTHTHTFTGSSGSAAALSEVANATDLSAVTGVRFVAYGK